MSEKSMENAHDGAAEAPKAPNHSAFQPQKGVSVLQDRLPAIQCRRIRAEKGDTSSMDHPLRPISPLELLDRTLSLYRRNFVKFAGLSIVGPVATFAYRLRYGGGTVALARLHSSSTAAPAVLGVLVGIVIVLAGASISSAATVEAAAAVSRGSRVRVAEGYRALGERLWRIIGIVLSVFIRAFPGGVLFIGAGVMALAMAAALGYNSRVEAGTIGYVCGGISLISAIFASIWICARYAVAVQACVVEDIGSRLALKRSTFLTAGDRGRVTIVHLAFLILVLAADFIFGAPTLLLPSHGAAFRISGAVAGLIAVALTSPVATIGMSLVYYDERARKEGPDRQPIADSLKLSFAEVNAPE